MIAIGYPRLLKRRQANSKASLPQEEEQKPPKLALGCSPRPMRFHFHVVTAETTFFDTEGVECESLRMAVDHARSAIEESTDLPVDGHLVITSPRRGIAIVLPLDDL